MTGWTVFYEINAKAAMRRLEAERQEKEAREGNRDERTAESVSVQG